MTRPLLAASIILGPLLGFALGAVLDRVLIEGRVTESPTAEWCKAAYVRKADFGLRVKSTYKPLEVSPVASGGEIDSDIVPRSKDSRQGH